jgi:hypothetical protein
MDPTAVFAFLTELTKLMNTIQTNKPPDQVKTESLFVWGIVSKILKVFLSADQKKQLADEGVNL